MNDSITRFTLRIDRDLFKKFRFIADYEGRTANRELEHYIKRRIMRFEEEHGEIVVEKEDE